MFACTVILFVGFMFSISTSASVVLAASLMIFPGCKASQVTHADFAELVHTLWADARAWWLELREPAIARVGGLRITPSHLSGAFQKYARDGNRWIMAPDGRRRLLHTLIVERLPEAAAKEAGVDQDPAYFRQLTQARRGLLKSHFQERFEAAAPIPEEEIRARYLAESPDFKRVLFFASHIVLKTFQDAEKARRMLAAGVPFARVVATMSIDRTSAARGGGMQPFIMGRVDPPFEKAYKRIPVGKTSGIIKTAKGYEIIRRDGEASSAPPPYEKVRDDLRRLIAHKRWNDQLAEMRSSYQVWIDSEALQSFSFPPQ